MFRAAKPTEDALRSASRGRRMLTVGPSTFVERGRFYDGDTRWVVAVNYQDVTELTKDPRDMSYIQATYYPASEWDKLSSRCQ